jgi:hypothetical protein
LSLLLAIPSKEGKGMKHNEKFLKNKQNKCSMSFRIERVNKINVYNSGKRTVTNSRIGKKVQCHKIKKQVLKRGFKK